MHTLPRNSTGHTLFLFFASFRRPKSALCHLLCEATCSLRTDKQLGNVTSVVEYSTAQQLDDSYRTMHIIHIFLSFMHISRLKYDSLIEKTCSNDNSNNFLCGRSNFKNSCFVFHRVSKRSKTIKPLVVSNVSRVWKPDETLALVFEILLTLKPGHLNWHLSLLRLTTLFRPLVVFLDKNIVITTLVHTCTTPWSGMPFGPPYRDGLKTIFLISTVV